MLNARYVTLLAGAWWSSSSGWSSTYTCASGTNAGHAIHGESAAGWAGYFDGRVFMNEYMELHEVSAPVVAPRSNRARLFVRNGPGGRTQLCVRFHTGTVRVLASQP